MKPRFSWLWLCASLFCTHSLIAQKKIVKNLEKVEGSYQKGKLKSANKKNESTIESILHTGNKENEFAIRAYANQSRIQQSMGRHFEYERGVNEAIALAKKTYSDTGKLLIDAYLIAAEVHYDYGNQRKAQEMIKQAAIAIGKTSKKYPSLSAKYMLMAGRVYEALGYLTRADSFATLALPLLSARIVKTELQADKRGIARPTKLSSTELASRKAAYGWATSLKGDIAFKRGLYKTADSLYTLSTQWTTANIGSKNPIAAHNLTKQGEILEGDGDLRQANNLYAKGFAAVKNRQDMFYYEAFEKMIYGKMIKDRFLSTPRKSLTLLDRKTKLYNNKVNVHYANKEILEEWFTVKKYHYNQSEDRLDKMLLSGKYLPKYHPSRLKAQQVYLLLDVRAKKLKSAEDTLVASLEIAKELFGDQSPAYHQYKLDLADFYLRKTNSVKKAEEIYLQSFVDVVGKEMSPKHRKYVGYLNDLGTAFALGENYSKAADYVQLAEKQAIINYDATKPKYALVLGNLASIYLNMGKYKQAKEMLDRAETILNKRNDDDYTPEYALTYQKIAEGYSLFGLFDRVEKALDKSEDIMGRNAKKGYDPAENSSPDDLASFYIHTGKYSSAEKILKQSVTEKEKSRGMNSRELIKPLNLLGKLYYLTGDYGQSEIHLNRASKLSSSLVGDSTLKYAESLKTLRKLYAAFGDYEKAEQVTKRQIDITNKILGKQNINVADALVDLAVIRYNLGAKQAESRAMLKESNKMFKEQLGADNPFYINGLKSFAFFQMETGQLISADSMINVAETYWEKKLGKDNIYTPEFDNMRGDLFRKQGKYDQALAKYDNALSQYKRKFSQKHPDYVKTLSKTAKTYYAKGDYKNSLSAIRTTTEGYYLFISKYFPALSFGEKSKYWELIKGDFEFFNSLALKLKDQDASMIGQMYDYELATKALLLSNSIKVRQRILTSGNKNLIDKFNLWNDKKELFTKALSYSEEQLKSESIDPVRLETEIETLEKELSASSEEFARSFENKTFRWKDVKKVLKENEAAVEVLRFRHYANGFTDSVIYAALIVSGKTTSNPELVVLPNGKQMEKKYIKYYRNTIKYMNEDELSYDVFWKPIDDRLKGFNTLYFSCEGVYNQINIETLKDGDDKYLIDKYNVILVSNTKDLVLNTIYEKKKLKKTESNNITLIGNPQFYVENTTKGPRSIPQLSGAEVEATEISDLYATNKWNNSLLTKVQADEDRIKNVLGPRIIHLATHGYFLPDNSANANDENEMLKKNEVNPLFRSGLLLSGAGDLLDNNFTVGNINSQNGILTAYEAMNLNLESTELVTLSACETGLGDIQIGEGVAGLQRSFLVAGADNVIMSLFKVNDAITEKLMLTFYNKWLKLGDKRKAFIEAKKEIKAQHPASIYWGSFIMIGLN